MIELKFLVPYGRVHILELQAEKRYLLGREQGDVTFPEDSLMSGRHLEVRLIENGIRFSDQGSTNGTFLNNVKCNSGEAFNGDELTIGQTRIRVKHISSSASNDIAETPRGKMLPTLVIEHSDGSFRRLDSGTKITIGRNEKSDWHFANDSRMSSRHATITSENGAWEVIDVGSANGTFLNNKRINQALLQHGDELRVGDNIFSVRMVNDSTMSSQLDSSILKRPYDATPLQKPVRASPQTVVSETQQWFPRTLSTRCLWLVAAVPKAVSICVLENQDAYLAVTSERDEAIVHFSWCQKQCTVTCNDADSVLTINGKRVQDQTICEGDAVHIGDQAFIATYSNTPTQIRGGTLADIVSKGYEADPKEH